MDTWIRLLESHKPIVSYEKSRGIEKRCHYTDHLTNPELRLGILTKKTGEVTLQSRPQT